MNQVIHLGLRGVQLLFAIILLGLTAYIVDHLLSVSQANFLLFTSIWTIFPTLVYLFLAPRFLSRGGHFKFADAIIDGITALFWFAGFIALAVWYHGLDFCFGKVCGTIVAACVFGAFEWLLFTATAVLSICEIKGVGFGRNTPAVKEPSAVTV